MKQVENSNDYIGIKELLNDSEYLNIHNKIETIKKCLDFVSIEMVVYRKKYITQDMIQLLLYEKISKKKLKDTEDNTNFYGRDGRSPLRMDLNFIISEIVELIILFKVYNLKINPLSVHNERTTKSNYNTDFVYKDDYFIEIQSSFKDIKKVLIKEAKYKGILKLYDKFENIYLLQQKINPDGTTLYKLINLRDFKKGNTVCRYSNKPEFEVEDSSEWVSIDKIKIGA